MITKRDHCAVCEGRELSRALTFLPTPLANEFLLTPTPQDIFPLELLLCHDCRHLQLADLVDPKRLFPDYVYVTGTSPVTRAHFAKYADEVAAIALGRKNARVVEIGSNDGTLLCEFKRHGAEVLGIDPAVDIARHATNAGARTLPLFFTSALAKELIADDGVADVVVANNVLAHAPDIRDIVRGVRTLIGRTGLFVFEVSYLLDIFEHIAFDTIYHEHYSYHAVRPLVRLLDDAGMTIVRVVRTPEQVGRGSIRVYARAAGTARPDETVSAAIAYEESRGVFSLNRYVELADDIRRLRTDFNRVIANARTVNRIMGYGAPAKMTTLLYTFGVDKEDIEYIVDDSTWKQGRLTPGMHIPVKAPARPPDGGYACIVFAWNFADSIISNCRQAGWDTPFIVPLPRLTVNYP